MKLLLGCVFFFYMVGVSGGLALIHCMVFWRKVKVKASMVDCNGISCRDKLAYSSW